MLARLLNKPIESVCCDLLRLKWLQEIHPPLLLRVEMAKPNLSSSCDIIVINQTLSLFSRSRSMISFHIGILLLLFHNNNIMLPPFDAYRNNIDKRFSCIDVNGI